MSPEVKQKVEEEIDRLMDEANKKEEKVRNKKKPIEEIRPDRGDIRIFVYGTLKTQHGNNVLLQNCNARCLGYDTIKGPFYMVSMGGFPAIVPTDNPAEENTIYGEVWYGDDDMLTSCDLLEGHPVWYRRQKVRTTFLERNVWVYVMPTLYEKIALDVIPGGMWRPTPKETAHWSKMGKLAGSLSQE